LSPESIYNAVKTPAVTAAYKKNWMPYAIILAILRMAAGTFWGMLTIYLFRVFLVSS
jgi:hypothetical protein